MEILPATIMTLEVNKKMLYGETLDEPAMYLNPSENKTSFVLNVVLSSDVYTDNNVYFFYCQQTSSITNKQASSTTIFLLRFRCSASLTEKKERGKRPGERMRSLSWPFPSFFLFC
jgi:hypothetical protein